MVSVSDYTTTRRKKKVDSGARTFNLNNGKAEKLKKMQFKKYAGICMCM